MVARYLLAYCKVSYAEKTYVMGEDEWKQNKDTVMPFANLPYIIDGDAKVSETMAVHQYIV